MQAFVQQSETLSQTQTDSLSAQRTAYQRVYEHFYAGRPAGVRVINTQVPTPQHNIPIRHYWPAQAPLGQVLYLHGGGFVLGNLDSHDDICAELCAKAQMHITAVDYRLAPEHPYPAAFEDALACYQHVSSSPHKWPLFLAGDSAGANLAAAVAHTSRQLPQQAQGLLLIYPSLGCRYTQSSFSTHANAPGLIIQMLKLFQKHYQGTQSLPTTTSFAPLQDKDFSHLPPVRAFAAQCDPLVDEAVDYCQAVQLAGGDAHCHLEKGLIHSYLRARHHVPEAGASFERIVRVLRDLSRSRL